MEKLSWRGPLNCTLLHPITPYCTLKYFGETRRSDAGGGFGKVHLTFSSVAPNLNPNPNLNRFLLRMEKKDYDYD
jgi:hypothetical protein